MDRVAWIVISLYVIVLAIFMLPFIYVAWYPTVKFTSLFQLDILPIYAIYLLAIFICQFSLLLIPVAIKSQRPVKRRSIIPAVIVGSLLLALLVFSFIASLIDVGSNGKNVDALLVSSVIIFYISWLAWGIYFWRVSVTAPPDAFINKLTNYLLKGSILEFLVAVPSHIIARQRTDCCAGFNTFMGLTFGVSIMLISFGPGIYYLYRKRIKRLRREE